MPVCAKMAYNTVYVSAGGGSHDVFRRDSDGVLPAVGYSCNRAPLGGADSFFHRCRRRANFSLLQEFDFEDSSSDTDAG